MHRNIHTPNTWDVTCLCNLGNLFWSRIHLIKAPKLWTSSIKYIYAKIFLFFQWGSYTHWGVGYATLIFTLSFFIQSYLTFCDPWTIGLQAPLSAGFSRQEYWSGLPCPHLADFPNPGFEPRSPALQVDSLPSDPQGKPWYEISHLSTWVC